MYRFLESSFFLFSFLLLPLFFFFFMLMIIFVFFFFLCFFFFFVDGNATYSSIYLVNIYFYLPFQTTNWYCLYIYLSATIYFHKLFQFPQTRQFEISLFQQFQFSKIKSTMPLSILFIFFFFFFVFIYSSLPTSLV